MLETDRFKTPKQIANANILSLTSQWRERKRGALKYFQIGRKIFYSDDHIREFFTAREKNTSGGRDD